MTTDWDELNPDLLPLIAKKLGDISNFVRFRAICKKWRSAVRLSDQPPQPPWFIQLPCHFGQESSNIKAYSLYSKRTHTVYIPEAKGAAATGSSSQYLLLDNSSGLSLFNPLTRSQIPLPCRSFPIGTIYHIGPSPNHNPSGLHVVVCTARGIVEGTLTKERVGMSRRDDRYSQWNIRVPCSDVRCYCEGRLFIYKRNTRDIRAIDPATEDVVLIISAPPGSLYGDFHLIESVGDIFAVVPSFKYNQDIPSEMCRFKVYRLKHEGKRSFWAKMSRGIGDRMLFLNGLAGFSLKATDFDGVKGNCIYFSKWNGKGESDARFAICRYDIEADKTKVLSQRKKEGTWFVPSLY